MRCLLRLVGLARPDHHDLWLRGLQLFSTAVDSAPTCVPVVIVGAGPSGLVMSSLLSQFGIQHLLLDKAAGITQHPQAHYINNRTMEVFRGLPGLSAAVSALSPPLPEWRRFMYCESMVAGQLLGEVDHFPGQDSPCDARVSPEPVAHLSQHRLSQLLLQQAQQLSGAAGASIRFNQQVDSVSLVTFPHQQQQQQQQQHLAGHQQQQALKPQQQQGAAAGGLDAVHAADEAAQAFPVCVAVTDNSQGQQQQQLVRCKYLVAADGSHSSIRQLLGIAMRGKPGMQHLISIHFTWPQLGNALLSSGRAAMLYFVFNSQVVSVMVAHNLQEGEFVAQVPYFPPLQSPSHFTPDLCQQLLRAAAGFTAQQEGFTAQQPGPTPAGAAAAAAADGSGLRIHSIKNWVMSAEVAEEYAAWGNRVLLVGDAAHRFPPAGGFGMNTGIQDAHNLAWKLAAVLTGRAKPALLSSYQPERRPVAQANADLSVSNWNEAIRVPQALGLDPRAATLVNSVISSAPLPGPLASWLLDTALATGRGLAAAVVPLRRGALQDILASGMSLRLQFPREDLGFVYTQGAVASSSFQAQQQGQQQRRQTPAQQGEGGSSSGSSIDSGNGSSSRKRKRRENVYVPAVVVGGRLPHCWLQLQGASGALHQVSTLDLCSPAALGLDMLLLCTAPPKTSGSSVSSTNSGITQGWVESGLRLQSQGWPLKVLQVLPQGTDLQAGLEDPSSAGGGGQRGQAHVGVEQQQDLLSGPLTKAVDVKGCWAQLQSEWGNSSSSSVVLVRPDGHIAWVAASAEPIHSSSDGSGGSSSAQGPGAMVLEGVLRDVLQLIP